MKSNQEDDMAIDDKKQDRKISRRKLLQRAAVGLVSGVVAPLLSSRAFAAAKKNGKVLIAYYSRTGTTHEIADQIQKNVGGDLFELKTAHTYPKAYRATTNQAKREQDSNFRPPLTADVPNIDTYDVVFIGYPNWWGTLPMAFFTFLERHRFGGKTLIPFCTHEGSGLGRGVSDIRSMCPNATILEGLALRGGGINKVQSESARRDVAQWLRKTGMSV